MLNHEIDSINIPLALRKYISMGMAILKTSQAADVLGLKPQTLRKWACKHKCPSGLKPLRIGKHLGWRIDELIKFIMEDSQNDK